MADLSYKRGIVQAPAGSGKTLIAAGALDAVIASRPRKEPIKSGWLCSTLEQKQQAKDALDKFSLLAHALELAHALDTRIECAAAQADWSYRDVLIVDEVSMPPANTMASPDQ